MNKKTQTTKKAPMSVTKQKALVITIICIVTAIVLATSLIIALWEAPELTFADKNNDNLATSSETIKNGDFEYVSEANTLYPKDAQNWNRYSYKKQTSATVQGYTDIGTSGDTVMGIVDTENWDNVSKDLAKYGITNVTNPGLPDDSVDKDTNSNIYMINNLNETTASIYSNSFSIAASTSVKITLNVLTKDVVGHGAFVMVKQSSVSACEKSSSGVQYWYAHTGVEGGGFDTNGAWETIELYVFNRTSNSKTVYINAGLGDVYRGTTSTGTMFIEDITYETVTANEYRDYLSNHSANDSKFYTIDTDEKEKETTDLAVSNISFGNKVPLVTTTSKGYLDNTALSQSTSPFVDDYAKIYSLTNDGTIGTTIGAETAPLTVKSPVTNSSYLISVWVRVVATNDLVLPSANIYLYKDGSDKAIAAFNNIKTADSSEITEDTTNGWVQYNLYVKPGNVDNDLTLKITLGAENGYINADSIPNGTLLFTQPTVEKLSSDQYTSATTGNTVSKTELNTNNSSTTISNGSFGYIANNSFGDDIHYPTDWQGLFAGSSEFLKDGKENITVTNTAGSVSGGVDLDSSMAPKYDDGAKGVLTITNNELTSYGFLSSDIELSAKTTYAISVLCHSGTGSPNMYLINSAEGDIYTLSAGTTGTKVDDKTFNLPDNGDSWTRYYFVITTGDNAMTVNLALFNGQIDATKTDPAKLSRGTVYFDQATITTLSTYVRDYDADEIFSEGTDGEWVMDSELAAANTFTPATGYMEREDMIAAWTDKANVEVIDLSATDVNEPVVVEEDEDEPTVTTPTDVNTSLLISIISSSLLVAALLIVIIVKFAFKNKTSHNN